MGIFTTNLNWCRTSGINTWGFFPEIQAYLTTYSTISRDQKTRTARRRTTSYKKWYCRNCSLLHCYRFVRCIFGGFPFGIHNLVTPFPKGAKFLDSKNHHQSKHLKTTIFSTVKRFPQPNPRGLHIFVDGRSAEPNRCDSSTDAIQKLIASNLRAKKKHTHTHRISSI